MTAPDPVNDNQQPPEGQPDGPNMGVLLLVAAVLVVVSWFVINTLRHNGKVQDCVMQGRSNCAEIVR